jgi:chromosome segregation ATPase
MLLDFAKAAEEAQAVIDQRVGAESALVSVRSALAQAQSQHEAQVAAAAKLRDQSAEQAAATLATAQGECAALRRDAEADLETIRGKAQAAVDAATAELATVKKTLTSLEARKATLTAEVAALAQKQMDYQGALADVKAKVANLG